MLRSVAASHGSPRLFWPQNSPAGNPEGLVGLWGAEQILTPMVSGELIIDARGAEWQATVGGFNALVQRANDRVAFTSTAL